MPNNDPTYSHAPGDHNSTHTGVPVPSTPSNPTERIERGPLPEVPGYELLGELGRGGMGVVYRARQYGLNRLVALKMVLAGTYARADELVRFLAEAETAARLHHHGIAQIFGTGRAGELPYFVMEFVDGGSLADRLASGLLPPTEAARIALQLAEAVAHAHAAGVVHRDLKPSNILLTAEGTPKITDFRVGPGSLEGRGRADTDWGGTRHPGVHAPGTGPWRPQDGRAARGRIWPGGRAVRDAHRPTAVPLRQPNAHAFVGAECGARETAFGEHCGSAGLGNDLPQVPGERARREVRLGGGAGRRLATLYRGADDPGAACQPSRAIGPLGEAQPDRRDTPDAGIRLTSDGYHRCDRARDPLGSKRGPSPTRERSGRRERGRIG